MSSSLWRWPSLYREPYSNIKSRLNMERLRNIESLNNPLQTQGGSGGSNALSLGR